MDIAEATKASKNGAVAALVSGFFTLVMIIVAMSSNAEGDYALFNDPSNFFDVILVFGCAFGMYRLSRAAAVVMLCYFIVAKVIVTISTGQFQGLIVSLIFIYYFGKAVQGTFTYHRIEKTDNPDYKAAPRWYAFVGIPLGLIFAVLIGFGLMTMTGAMPSAEVLAGDKLPNSEVRTLLSEGIIDDNEQVVYFYSAGVSSILEDGNLLTDRRVISYFTNNENELEMYELFFAEIRNVELVQDGNFLNDSIYKVFSNEGDAWLLLYLSTTSRGDIRFIEALRENIDQSR